MIHCSMCSGEYCYYHHLGPCDCDTADRHGEDDCPLLIRANKDEPVVLDAYEAHHRAEARGTLRGDDTKEAFGGNVVVS